MDLTIIIIGLLLLVATLSAVNLFRKRINPSVDLSGELKENARLVAELSQRDKKIGEVGQELQSEKTNKNQLLGQREQMIVEIANLKAERVSTLNEKNEAIKKVNNFEATEEHRVKEFNNRIQKLDEAKAALDDEKQRIRREDEEKLQKEKEERNRMWAEHEENVKFKLAEVCKDPRYGFQYYDNNNLPDGFGGKFKPDSLIKFQDQYVIFDAKKSESDLQNYINNAVNSTAEKIDANKESIYRTVFFVVPTETMKLLKKISFDVHGYNFFVIPPEAIEIVLASFKKISTYDLTEKLDPQDRENIVNLIAEFDYHINMRNALDILASESGISVLKKIEIVRGDIIQDVTQKKIEKTRLQPFSTAGIKPLLSTEKQSERINELTLSKSAIPEDNLKRMGPILGKKGKKNKIDSLAIDD